MAEYSRLASGQVVSTGGQTAVILPFIPSYIEIFNPTRAAAVSGVTRAWWELDMGQGAAAVVTTSAGPADGTSYITAATGGGFSTIQAALSQQYGATVLLGGAGGITKHSSAPVVTTTAAHGLVTGDVVIFQNLYQTASTGMQQIAGMPFYITYVSSTSFSIQYNTNQSNFTAISTGGLNTLASFKQVLFPALYVPGTSVVWKITAGATTAVYTTAPHQLQVGQEVAFRMPSVWGMSQLNSLPNVIIPGSPVYGYVTVVNSSTQVTVAINSSAYTAFNSNQSFASFPGEFFPQMVAVGDANSGSLLSNFVSPSVYSGYSSSAVSTINGPSIAGAYINASWMGFLIGASVSGTAADVIYWRAQLDDLTL